MDAFIGEVRIFCGTFPPDQWLDCNGQVLPADQYQGLYSVIGNVYGGTAPNTFALPNLNGRAPMHQGSGKDLTPRQIGVGGGVATVTLNETQIPNHTHVAQSLGTAGSATTPTDAVWASPPPAGRPPVAVPVYGPAPANTAMHAQALSTAGASQPHDNMQPYVPVRFIIAYEGVYPVRS